jgi:uncharacterized protein YuzE
MTSQAFAEYSERADAAYVYLHNAPVVRTEPLDERRNVDYAVDGRVVGVEFFGVSERIDLSGVPEAETVRQALSEIQLGALTT